MSSAGNCFNLQSADLIDLVAERASLDIDPVLDLLDRELVGLAPVKARVHQIAAVLVLDRLRFRYGLTSSRPNLHMCFTGGPGTGKTMVALRIAEILKVLGLLARGHLVTVRGDDLVGQRIDEVLDGARGGVLFVDHASHLSAEVIEVLLQAMETHREELIVILAGTKSRMESLFDSNPGVKFAIAHHIDFPDFTIDQLCAIADRMLADERYAFSVEARDAFGQYLEWRRHQPGFANARSVRSALEGARLRHASRMLSSGRVRCSRQDLMRIEVDDVLAGRTMAGVQS